MVLYFTAGVGKGFKYSKGYQRKNSFMEWERCLEQIGKNVVKKTLLEYDVIALNERRISVSITFCGYVSFRSRKVVASHRGGTLVLIKKCLAKCVKILMQVLWIRFGLRFETYWKLCLGLFMFTMWFTILFPCFILCLSKQVTEQILGHAVCSYFWYEYPVRYNYVRCSAIYWDPEQRRLFLSFYWGKCC